MFKRIILLTMMVCCIPIITQAANNLPTNTELKVTLDQDALMELDVNTRNNVLAVLQQQTEKDAENADKAQEAVGVIAGLNVEEFKGKAVAFAETINIFCEKIGVTVNDFITTPAGNFIVFGALWKLGFFGSIWSFFKGVACASVLLWLLYSLNTRKIVKLNEYDSTGKVISSSETLTPRFTAVFSEDTSELTCYSVISSFIVVVLLFLAVCFVL